MQLSRLTDPNSKQIYHWMQEILLYLMIIEYFGLVNATIIHRTGEYIEEEGYISVGGGTYEKISNVFILDLYIYTISTAVYRENHIFADWTTITFLTSILFRC
ncbi:hypothetical protein LG660_03265 [Coxiella-like endosymbiont]|nr:hypothetical protein LG660_03265 [Coxiella-like endosymbiont]